MAIVAVSKALREKLGEDGTNSLVELLSSIEEKTEDRVILRAEDRFEKRLTKLWQKIQMTNEIPMTKTFDM